MPSISSYTLSAERIQIGTSAFPVIVAYITLDSTPTVGAPLSVSYSYSVCNAIANFATSNFCLLGCGWGSNFDNFYSSINSVTVGNSDEFSIYLDKSGRIIRTSLSYKGAQLASYQTSWGSHASNECSAGVGCIFVDNASQKIFRIYGASMSMVPDSNIVVTADVIPPFGIQNTDGILWGVLTDPELRSSGSGSVGLMLLDELWSDVPVPPPVDTDPYAPDGTSGPGGGGGTPDPSEDITDPSLPTVSAVDTGFITLFKPSVSNLNSLATYLWSGGFDIDTFKKVMANPMDAILGLSILPGIVPSGGSSTVVIGNVSTGVSMPKVGNQYVKFNCGSKTIKRKWNAFLDYSPYTRAYIYLPYIGIHPLEVDDIMNKSVTVKYNIDVLSGGCTAFVIAGGTTLYSFTGQCACSVPVTGRDWTSLINGVLGAVTGTVGAIGSAMVGNLPGAIAGAASVAQNVLSSKPTIERSGSMGGMAGMMGIRTPYIIIERPVQAVPGKQNKYIGYPSFVTKKLGDVSGYTQAEITHLNGIPATLSEQEEIKTILEEGVIL